MCIGSVYRVRGVVRVCSELCVCGEGDCEGVVCSEELCVW